MNQTIRTNSFSLSMADYMAFGLLGYTRAFFTWPYAPALWLFAVICPATIGLAAAHGHMWRGVTTALPFAALWLVFIPLLSQWRIWRTTKIMRSLNGPRTVEADANHFTMTGLDFEVRQDWSGFSKVWQTRTMYCLVLRGSGCAYLVRKDAFDAPQGAIRFFDQARQFIKANTKRQIQVFGVPPPSPAEMAAGQPRPFRLTFSLFALYYLAIYVRSVTRPMTMLFFAILFFGLPAWYRHDELTAGHWQTILLQSVIQMVAFLTLFPFLMVGIAWLISQRNPAARGDRRIVQSDKGIRAFGDRFDVTLRWETLRAVSRHFGAIFYWSGPVSAMILPVSAFNSPTDAQAFFREATDHIATVKRGG